MQPSCSAQQPPHYYYRASYPYAAAVDGQLSIVAGDVLVVPQPVRQQGGWIWVQRHHDGTAAGWVPLSYLVPEQQREPQYGAAGRTTPGTTGIITASSPSAPRLAAASSNNPFDHDDSSYHAGRKNEETTADNDWSFGGTSGVMGGDWTSNKDLPAAVASSVPTWSQQQTRTTTTSPSGRSTGLLGLGGRLGSGLKGVGASVQQLGQQAGAAVGSAAQKTVSKVQHAAVETKHRVHDMRQQQQQPPPCEDGTVTKQQQPAATTTAVSQRQDRTKGEQMQVNAANGAARGALVGGATAFILSGGSVAAATRSATVHSVYGGAYGAAGGWKPFGK
jgi:hypothetical protein